METKYLYVLLSLLFLPLFFTPSHQATANCDPPCMNSGTCKPNNACQCANNGWTGVRCEVPLCTELSGCRTGVCVAPNVCNCNGTGYTGNDCSTPVCNNACQNGGKCVGPNACDCTGTGYTGAVCTVPICNAPIGCGPGNCVAPEVCNCTQGWTGKYCDTPICDPPCQHGGLCYGPNACDCTHTNYTDALCQTPLCTPPCQNGGQCTAPDTCDCTNAVGWTGAQCHLGICANPCQNGGYCSAPDQCNCENTGYAGEVCEVDINECLQKTAVCDKLTTCTNKPGSYECSACPSGYFGNGKVSNGGCFQCTPSCVNGQCIAANTCNCTSGYTGAACDTDIDECSTLTAPCDPLTTCVNTAGSYHCTACPPGYSGSGETGCVQGSDGSTTAFTPVITEPVDDGSSASIASLSIYCLLVAIAVALQWL